MLSAHAAARLRPLLLLSVAGLAGIGCNHDVPGLAGIGCHRTSSSSDPTSQLPVAPVVLPQRAVLSNQLEVAGELLPYQEVELHAKVSGYIRNIYVDIGDRVRKGQVLAELEIPELVAQVDEAQSGVLRSQQDI